MLPAAVNAPKPEFTAPPTADVLFDLYVDHRRATGLGNPTAEWAARSFLEHWPNPQAWADEPLGVRLSLPPSATSLVMFLMTRRWLAPGWDWLVSKKLSSFWREIPDSPLEADMRRFVEAAVSVGFTPIVAKRAASQSIGRLLIQTGRGLDDLALTDLDALADACRAREAATGQGWQRTPTSAAIHSQTLLLGAGPRAARSSQSASFHVVKTLCGPLDDMTPPKRRVRANSTLRPRPRNDPDQPSDMPSTISAGTASTSRSAQAED